MQSGRPDGFARSLPRLVAALIVAGCWGAQGQTQPAPDAPEIRARESAPPFQIKVETNLVMVRVVVRDAKGHPVDGLRKEDFRLFDSGKPQEITGFSVETAAGKPAAAETEPAPSASNLPSAPVPQRFVALYFDDLHMELGAVGQTRDAAWRYISTSLQPEDRVGIFTSSNQGSLNFTSDRGKLHDALFRLASHSRTNPMEHQCPAIGEYQAYLIAERQQADALEIAVEEGNACHCEGMGGSPDCGHAERINAQMLAAQIWDLADAQSLYALDVMEGVVNLLAARPGQRSLVLVSPGFLSATRAPLLYALIDRALRQNVVVNAMDAAGLYGKTYHDPLLMKRPDLDMQKLRMENDGIGVQRDVLVALAEGTGGTFFHNSNDFDEGLRQTAQAPEVYYVLSFSPADAKMDGKFHPLKVTVKTGDRLVVQARRGYSADAPLAEKDAGKKELESLIYSQDERLGLPATVTALAGQPIVDAATVTVKVHVDLQALQFRTEADRAADTLTFDTALFDRDGKYVAGKESSLDFRLTDAKLAELLRTGINAETSFRVAPGAYRVREVVRDAGSNKLAALNGNVEVAAPQPAQARKEKKREIKAMSMADWSVAQFQKTMPELKGLEPAANEDRLPLLLEGVGQNVERFFATMPEISAHERIDMEREGFGDRRSAEFNYLALPKPGQEGIALEEFRTNAAGKRVEPHAGGRGFVTKGFVSMIIHFHPSYQSESTFRYLGTQTMDGHATDVVYFAQNPATARVKQTLKTALRSLEIIIQGVVWIDSVSYHIVRMRTEMEPRADLDLKGETTESRFSEVHFKGVPQPLWLPEEVTVTVTWGDTVYQNRHLYSDFQLFRVDASSTPGRAAAQH
jgi:VWFA-related protein